MTVSRSSGALVLAAVLGITGFNRCLAQTFLGGVRGLIEDPGGAVLAGANVTLANEATGVTRTTVSTSAGEYVFSQVEPARYTIAVESSGFKRLERKSVIIGTQEFLTLDLKMELGQVNEKVEVTSEVPLIETTNASNGHVLDTQQVEDLPNLGRDIFLLAKEIPTVVAGGDPRWNLFESQIGVSQMSIGGGPVRGNNYFIDGIPVTDSINRSVIIPAIEAVGEMKVQEGTYDATMGRTGGGVFNVLLKSGTNDLHGELMGYLRTTALTANTFFANAAGQPLLETNYKDFGGYIGGPVFIPRVYNGKNKTFFSVSMEGYRQHLPYTNVFEVPTALEAQGNYSAPGSVRIFDSLSTRPCAPSDNCPAGVSQVRDPFPGNIIPQLRINSVGAAISRLAFPTPNTICAKLQTDCQNFTGSQLLYFGRGDQYKFKLEHVVNQWLRFTGSFLYLKTREQGGNPLGTAAPASQQGDYINYRHVDATFLNAILTPNPTTVVNLRYGFNRFPQYGTNPSAYAGFNQATLGFPASYLNSVPLTNTFPQIVLSGETLSTSGQSWNVYHSKNFLASVSKNIGRHNITTGFDYRRIMTGPTLSLNQGSFTFNGVFSRQYPTSNNNTGADFADILLGNPSAGSVTTSLPIENFVYYFSGYIQDDIRVTNRLTVNIGLRYEYETGEAEVNNRMAIGFDTTQVNPIASNLPPGSGVSPLGVLRYAGVGGNPTSCCNPSGRKFGPRFGAAYQLNAKTTVRAGFGLFYAPLVFDTGDSSVGYTLSNSYIASNDGNATPANSLSNPFPNGIQKPSGNSLGPLTAIGQNFSVVDQNRSGGGRVWQFSADIQRELAYGIMAEVGYFGSRSYDISPASTGTAALPINELNPSYLPMGQAALNTSVANPFYGHGGAGVIGSAKVTQAQLLLPYPEYGTISLNAYQAHARYDALVTKVQKRFSKGLTFMTSFTWSRNEDNEFGSGVANALNGLGGAATGGVQNIYNLNAEWALAAIDTPWRWTGTWTYQLPFGKGKPLLNGNTVLNYVVGGWALNGAAVIQSGLPMYINQSNLNASIGGTNQRANATGVNACMSGNPESRMNNYINPAAFSLAPADTFGNLSRNISCLSPGLANWDTSLFKDFKFKERYTVQFRAEALNTFNTPQFATPYTTYAPGSVTFGHVTYQCNLPRNIQLGLFLRW